MKKHNNISTKGVIALFVLLFMAITSHGAPKVPKPIYIPMDYSTCGYRASEAVIPDVAPRCYVTPVEGDNSKRIQKAIDYVSSLKPDANGHRGTILLAEGTYNLNERLYIRTSGVVVRGADRDKTILRKQGYDRGAVIYIEGEHKMTKGDTLRIADVKVMAGTTRIPMASTAGLHIGDRIQIMRPGTPAWIRSLGMTTFGGGLGNGWKAGDLNIRWDRTVIGVKGDSLIIDSPITTTLNPEYGGGYVVLTHNEGEICETGVENITIESVVNGWNPKDEDHSWEGVNINDARDSWVRRVKFLHMAGSAVNVQRWASRITVEDCIADEPVSEIGGWRRMVFLVRGQQVLVQRCVSSEGYHAFVADQCAAGPNAFVQCDAERALNFSGSIGSWAAGLLFDMVNIDGNDLYIGNLELYQGGVGWNSANTMLWQSTAATIRCYSPDEDNRCSANACWADFMGNAEWTNSNIHTSSPRCLFYGQLKDRMGDAALDGHVMNFSLKEATNPPLEDAIKIAYATMNTPAPTLRAWLDSVPYTATVVVGKAISVDKVKTPEVDNTPHRSLSTYGVRNGHLAMDGKILTGNEYNIIWWAGSTKDSYLARGAQPVLTRFVPGREGTGLTDHLQDVVDHMAKGGYGMIYHHYGLWYDLRRTDHERVRRANGEVVAPFYEQAVSRSGQGTAFDGLSQYDVTKPNLWYWNRLREFATRASNKGIMLFNNHYFQHNILEAGAHWVDCPWRPVNNINGTNLPEPVHFAGDKRVFISPKFYDVDNKQLTSLHREHIRLSLDQLKDEQNVVHLISAEYTGPLHFTKFWLQTIAEWEAETGRHPLIALSCTKDVQDALLEDPEVSKVIDIIDIRYWHPTQGEPWAPKGGRALAPRQWQRQLRGERSTPHDAYRAIREYRERYPEKAVTYYTQQYPSMGWLILMAGGSMPNVRIDSDELRAAVVDMKPSEGNGCYVLSSPSLGYVLYANGADASAEIAQGKYDVYSIDTRTGAVVLQQRSQTISGTYSLQSSRQGTVLWLKKK